MLTYIEKYRSRGQKAFTITKSEFIQRNQKVVQQVQLDFMLQMKIQKQKYLDIKRIQKAIFYTE